MGDTTISWTEKTWNPIRGCSKVSAGCTHCYAETIAARFSGPGQAYSGTIGIPCKSCNGTGFRNGAAVLGDCGDCKGTGWNNANGRWNGEVITVRSSVLDPLRWRDPKMVFVNSMSDMFHEQLTNDRIALLFVVMLLAKQHTFQVLTKRAARMRQWFAWAGRMTMTELFGIARRELLAVLGEGADDVLVPDEDLRLFDKRAASGSYTWPARNIWIGVSVENQAAADERIPHLLACPAVVHFLSCEPLLERVELGLPRTFLVGATARKILRDNGARGPIPKHLAPPPSLEWVIAGCESGHGARPCDVDWLRQLRDDCARAGVPFFLKQAQGPTRNGIGGTRHIEPAAKYFDPSNGAVTVGYDSHEKAGGVIELPLLDGMQHAAFPVLG